MPPSRSISLPLVLTVASVLSAAACVTLDLRQATRPYVGRNRPEAPVLAVAEAQDRRDDPRRFGRVGWNVFSFSGDAGQKFRNTLMSALADHGYNVRFVGYKNVLNYDETARAVAEAGADVLLTAAVLELRVYSTDPFFDPADIDLIAQVSLLDPQGRTIYTRHVHAHEDKRLWFNPAFGAMDVLDDVMERVANYVARDVELANAVQAVRSARLYGTVPSTVALPVASDAGPATPPDVPDARPEAPLESAHEAPPYSPTAEQPAEQPETPKIGTAEIETPEVEEPAGGATLPPLDEPPAGALLPPVEEPAGEPGRVRMIFPGDEGRIESGEFER